MFSLLAAAFITMFIPAPSFGVIDQVIQVRCDTITGIKIMKNKEDGSRFVTLVTSDVGEVSVGVETEKEVIETCKIPIYQD